MKEMKDHVIKIARRGDEIKTDLPSIDAVCFYASQTAEYMYKKVNKNEFLSIAKEKGMPKEFIENFDLAIHKMVSEITAMMATTIKLAFDNPSTIKAVIATIGDEYGIAAESQEITEKDRKEFFEEDSDKDPNKMN